MKNCKIYNFLKNKKINGDNKFYSASEIAKSINHSNGGNLFRKLNNLAVKLEVIEVKLNLKPLRRVYRMKEDLKK